jgi:hypothetical protein
VTLPPARRSGKARKTFANAKAWDCWDKLLPIIGLRELAPAKLRHFEMTLREI